MYYELEGLNTRLVGGMHLIPAGETRLHHGIDDGFNWAKTLEIEHDIDKAGALILQANTAGELWAKALFASMAGVATAPGAEARLRALLASRGRAVDGYLEDYQGLLGLLRAIPPRDAEIALERALGEPTERRIERMASMYKAWISGSPDAVSEANQDQPLLGSATVRQAMLTFRNHAWADGVGNRGPMDKPHLIVVGCLHLTGPDSLVELLRSKGIESIPLS